MKKILLLVTTSLVCLLSDSHQLFSQNILIRNTKGENILHSPNQNSSINSSIDSVDIIVLYAMGVIPFEFGCPDTLGIRLKKNIAGGYDVKVRISMQLIDTPFAVINTDSIVIVNSGTYDTLLNYEIPCQGIAPLTFSRYRLIVEALPGNRSTAIFDTKEYCQYSTYDAYNYADSCLALDGGVGIVGGSGNFVARFNNYSSHVFPIGGVDYSMFNNPGANPYKIVIYGDNGSGKPGTLLYASSTLTSPVGSAYLTHTLSNQINIAANSRFYVGLRQTTSATIGVSTQTENPVRSRSFFYSIPDTSTSWTDFSTAGLNSRIYISPFALIDVPVFAAKVDFTAGNNPISLCIADLDGDGKRDLAVSNLNSNTLSVLRNTSSPGTVSLASKIDFPTGDYPRSVSIGDIDGDGKRDLAVSNYNSNTVSVFRNLSSPGNISFASKVDFVTGNNPRSVSVGDINLDGKLDLAVTNEGSNTVSIFRNTSASGTVNFASKSDFATGTSPLSVMIGDVNTDGKPDLAVANYSSNTVSILRNTTVSGSVSFASKIDFVTGSNPYAVNIGDLDGDYKSDMAVSNNSGNTVSVFRNTTVSGSVSFAAKIDFATGTNPNNIALGDLNGDGKSELTVSNTNDNTVSVFRNKSDSGNISFSAMSDFGTGLNPYSVSIGDIDGDNRPDMATANRNSNNVSVLRNVLNFQTQNSYLITIIPEGFYNSGNNTLSMSDTVRAYLRNINSPYAIVDSSKAVVNAATFTGNFNFANAGNGTYYIMLKHRNSIETWSKSGGEVYTTGNTLNYDFTTSVSKAYGNNMVMAGTKWCIFSGDVNQDGTIDVSDISEIDNDALNFATGYLKTDINGDDYVDLTDIIIADNNSYNFVSVQKP